MQECGLDSFHKEKLSKKGCFLMHDIFRHYGSINDNILF